MAIQVTRDSLIDKLSKIKDDNISIAGITIDRRKLLEALKLQVQPESDIVTIVYGNLGWHYDYTMERPKDYHEHRSIEDRLDEPCTWEYKPDTKEPEPCIRLLCDHTTMSFFNRPYVRNHNIPTPPMPLNFVETLTTHELSGLCYDSGELLNAVNYVIHGIAFEDSRPVLACIYLDMQHGKVVTADGFRLSIAGCKPTGKVTHNLLIPREDIPKLQLFLKNNYTGKGKSKTWLPAYLDFDKHNITFKSDKGRLTVARFDGTFPNYDMLIPQGGATVKFVASEILETVKSVSIAARDGSDIVRLYFDGSSMKLTAYTPDTGDIQADCRAKINPEGWNDEGKPMRIAANAKYLIDCLSMYNPNTAITMKLTRHSSPMIFMADNKVEVVMPMSVQW